MKTDDIAFLRAKIDYVAEAASNPGLRDFFFKLYYEAFLRLTQKPSIPKAHIQRFDRQIESFVAISPSQFRLEDARKKLRVQFGFDRIGKDFNTVIKLVHKRGRILNDSEAEIVREFASDVSNETKLGAEFYSQLCLILDRFEANHS